MLNEEHRIEETLRELIAYLEMQSFTASVVVVDNGCADRTLDRIDGVASEQVPIGSSHARARARARPSGARS